MSNSSKDSSDDSDNEIVDIKGEILKNKYIPIKKISSGKYSSIWLTYILSKKHLENHNYCILKQYDNTDDGIEQADDELKCLTKLNNAKIPNVIPIIDSFKYDTDYQCIIYPLMAMSLNDIIEHQKTTLSIDAVKIITKKMLLTLKKLHNIGIIHTDIKPENILVDGDVKYVREIIYEKKLDLRLLSNRCGTTEAIKQFIKKYEENDDSADDDSSSSSDDEPENDNKYTNFIFSDSVLYLIDFATCIQTKERCEDHYNRTCYYVAPEDILQFEIMDASTDIWALGCTIYELLTGKLLFDPKKKGVIGNYSSHLYQIQTLLGLPSDEYLSKCKNKINYYTSDGRLKGWDEYKYIPLNKKILEHKIKGNTDHLIDFLSLIFQWNPKDRAHVDKLLEHNWLKNIPEIINRKKINNVPKITQPINNLPNIKQLPKTSAKYKNLKKKLRNKKNK